MLSPHSQENKGSLLAMLWVFATFNILFRDIHELTTASALAEISSGYLNGNPVTEEVLFAGSFGVVLYLLAIPASFALPNRAARILNMIFPVLATIGVYLGQPSDPDDFVFATVEIFTFGLIFWIASRWRVTEPMSKNEASHV
ncbi:DUF6326 family protein [Cognatishimia activa]|uniref:DUF6326 family protein n=1 Tax=Cognatishimia activa TaxID=1715691 RepID=UPI0022313B43|nr:DUF6326 family protein [Cognatishimia activa]UZD89635.1 DUF6326 family protein [Cognatishimia activa]